MLTQKNHIEKLFDDIRGMSTGHFQKQTETLQALHEMLQEQKEKAPRRSHFQVLQDKQDELISSFQQKEKELQEMMIAQAKAKEMHKEAVAAAALEPTDGDGGGGSTMRSRMS